MRDVRLNKTRGCNGIRSRLATTTILAKRTGRPTRAESQRRQSVAQSRASGRLAKRKTLPEYLEPGEVQALIEAASHADAQILMLEQCRAGLRIAEALNLEVADLDFRYATATTVLLERAKDGLRRHRDQHEPGHDQG